MAHIFAKDKRYKEIIIAIEAVQLAGRLCRSVQSGTATSTLTKDDHSPVTVADFGSQALICRRIAAVFPADKIIAEEDSAALIGSDENGAMLEAVTRQVSALIGETPSRDVCRWIDHGATKSYSDRFWTLDPIDGTKGFLGGRQYAIALALIVEGRLTAAVVGCPNLGPNLSGKPEPGTLFAAIRGAGTFSLPLFAENEQSPSQRITVSSCSQPTQIRFCESFEAAHSSHDDSARLARLLAINAPAARLDSQAKYGVVARGEAEAYLRLPRDEVYREKIWDHAAGALIVTEAGGRVTDIDGHDLDFTCGYRLEKNRGIVATNGLVHDKVLDAIGGLP